jgi:hypothetical protein
MMKKKGKSRVEVQVNKLVKKKPMSMVKESQKMDTNEFKWAR